MGEEDERAARDRSFGGRRGIATLAIIAALLSGCYQSHGRVDLARPDSGREIDAGARDGGRPADAGRLPDAGVQRCEGTWDVVAPLQLTFPPSDDYPSDVEWTGAGYLVGFQSSNPDLDQSRFAQLVSHGVVGEPQRVFGPPSGTCGGMGIATNGDAVAAVTWDARGCFFRRIAADGSGLADERRIDANGCVGLTETGSGFSVLDYPGSGGEVRFHRLDVNGGSIGRVPRLEIFRDDVFFWARAEFDDDSQLFAVMRGGVSPTSAAAQPVDAEGGATGPEVTLPASGVDAGIHAIATGSGVLIGWYADESGDPDSQERVVTLMRATRDGRVLGEPFTLSGVRAYRDAGWTMVRVRGENFVVYVEPMVGDRSGRETVIRALRIDDEGAALAEPLNVAEVLFGRRVIARTNGASVLIAYAANGGSSNEVFTAELECILEM